MVTPPNNGLTAKFLAPSRRTWDSPGSKGLLNVRILFVLLLAAALYGQEYRGNINGRVTDPSGATIAGAKVHVKNLETGVAVDASTNNEGNYQAPFLLPGNYSISVEHPGFKSAAKLA